MTSRVLELNVEPKEPTIRLGRRFEVELGKFQSLVHIADSSHSLANDDAAPQFNQSQ